MNSLTIYHNPRCSKSREALKLLHDQQLEPTVIDYLKTPLTVQQLDQLLKKLDLPPEAVIRFKEPIAGELNLKKSDARTRKQWLALLAEHPVLLERPIVALGNSAAIGRPIENITALLTGAR